MTYALYYYDMCPFCQMVLRTLPGLKVDVEKRNVQKNPAFRKQQQQATGRTTVPCLLITDDQGKEEWMFESADIIRYLKSL
ncbi:MULTISPECIES: glutaredoxin domain-containing protein [unclassified Oceanobacter]|jgi:glutaredoxin|uniref:glutaredoxin family protein n=1 Tax=unclassified Oceanobacter TaxID=2620260 RepID=UPI0026E3913C|nr:MULTISPECIES: glutaredoxin domain-containing protein [unclassified Oceanobacter]MDO6681742.1 glutaredoxin domain-containing protein [Oceanobacter sp. 5_MG-2023]MDP2505144.1 glutaredoxin domain-containing protein [Oceanobacter sp. 3_MG-2023]MDP2549183.1 glutaredoxin domain-containing protein [Oceanobacter sp. 4_MG-2023]MDP2610158.1 glutaredoxin domain-containing protein [Oceanobacter sp. 1_MG-2023]MDP2613433.1 glutaredoxin domain-containing protein [Oceanobacter sp. 2_MG-2023]